MFSLSQSAQSMDKKKTQCKGLALYQENIPIGVLLMSCEKQLWVTWKAGAYYYYVLFDILFTQDLGLDSLKLETVDNNKGFIIHTFFRF